MPHCYETCLTKYADLTPFQDQLERYTIIPVYASSICKLNMAGGLASLDFPYAVCPCQKASTGMQIPKTKYMYRLKPNIAIITLFDHDYQT